MDDPRRTALRAEHGFSMAVVMIALLIGGLLVTAALAAANSDLPFSRASQDRKSAYAAAEAGVSYYSFRLNQDNDYWTRCTSVPAPSTTEPSPVNQQWTGKAPEKDPRIWRTVPDAKSQYTIELRPAPGYTTCQPGVQKSMLDPYSGSFRVRVTGRPKLDGKPHRSINLTYRRKSFLDFLYFTNYETIDPSAYPPSSPAPATCADRPRSLRSGCQEIQFVGADKITGPLHTNDESVQVCGAPEFGETAEDPFEVTGGGTGFVASCSPAAPKFLGTKNTKAATMEMPQSNAALAREALSGYAFAGRTWLHFTGTGIEVRNLTRWPDGAYHTVSPPPNGVIYVANSASGTCSPGGGVTTLSPVVANYSESNACGNAYVSGTYRASVTIGAANDIIVGGTRTPTTPADRSFVRDGDVVAGLIADQFVRVYNRVSRTNVNEAEQCTGADTAADVRIDAAILSLQHSFMVDNHSAWNEAQTSLCPTRGTLTVHGAIAQKYRGPTGTTRNPSNFKTGFYKAYTYDRRLRFRSPPFFIDPVAAAWRIVRRNEQVPAT